MAIEETKAGRPLDPVERLAAMQDPNQRPLTDDEIRALLEDSGIEPGEKCPVCGEVKPD